MGPDAILGSPNNLWRAILKGYLKINKGGFFDGFN